MPGVPDVKAQEMIAVLDAADRFIPGLLDSSAGVDLDSRTVLWENTFVDEASYSGPYMVHPYHIGAIDNYVMPDSPFCKGAVGAQETRWMPWNVTCLSVESGRADPP